ncbi:hypothetical protein FRC04_009826 [Tulasnella sp. 424]|nr:hypothetical protein FRC04_009826 [Tulasnella sp. 424]KAG8972894.1 hypothetical protein FRC05_009448 [Tulasnella sp. 425]
MNYYNPTPRRQDTSYIGKPIPYAHGPNAGKTIRAELSEYQKPDLGRKFAKRDRRPLDPPPVVRVRLWEVFDAGLPSQTERELAAEDVEVQGLVAHVDLFRANPDGSIQVDNPTETAGLTKHCFGSSFVHATHILDLTGQPAIIFVFADLSVRLEGVFALRYRIFDLVSRVEGSDAIPVAAELYGGIFTVYSTKEFPGLQASTPLTKHLSRWGVRVNLREGERKRKAGGDDDDDDDDDGDDDEGGDADAPGPSKKGGAAKGGRAKGGAAKASKPKAVRPTGPSDTSISQAHASFSDFQTPHQPELAGPSAVPESLSQFQSTSGHPGSTSSPNNRPQSSAGVDDKAQARDPGGASDQQTQWLGAAPVSWSRPPLATANSGGDWSRPPTTQPIAGQSAPIADWSRKPNKQITDPTNPHQRGQEGSGPPREQPSRKRARMTMPNGAFDADTAPGLSQPSPEDVASLSISSSSRMLSAGNSMPMNQSPNFIASTSQPPNYAQVLYTPSQPPALVPAQRTNSFSPGNTFAMQPPNTVPVTTGHLATQSPISMHSSASFAIPSSTTRYGYGSAR